MLLFGRYLRCLVLGLVGILSGVCAAQVRQVVTMPPVQPTGGRLTSSLASSQTPRTGPAIATATTVTNLFLCVGPTAACPAGSVKPIQQSTLNMVYGQFWNGTVVVTPSDSSALGGNTVIYDSYNGGPPLPICTLPTALGGACDPSVGTTVGTSPGVHVIAAVYVSGVLDPNHSGSASSPVTINVASDTSNATLIGAPNPSSVGQSITFTAMLTGQYAAPTGTVVFSHEGTVLGSGLLAANGSSITSAATFTTSALPPGDEDVTAAYAGTVDFAAASATFTETITPPLAGNFTLTVTPTPMSVGVGYSALFTVTVTPQNGFAQGVNLACGNLPSETTCFFDTANLDGGGGTTNLVVATTAPHSCDATPPNLLGTKGGGSGVVPIALPALAGVLAMFLPGHRRWLRGLIALAVAVTMTPMTGCGNKCIALGTHPATYTFQVTASSTGTTDVESQPVTITVTI